MVVWLPPLGDNNKAFAEEKRKSQKNPEEFAVELNPSCF